MRHRPSQEARVCQQGFVSMYWRGARPRLELSGAIAGGERMASFLRTHSRLACGRWSSVTTVKGSDQAPPSPCGEHCSSADGKIS